MMPRPHPTPIASFFATPSPMRVRLLHTFNNEIYYINYNGLRTKSDILFKKYTANCIYLGYFNLKFTSFLYTRTYRKYFVYFDGVRSFITSTVLDQSKTRKTPPPNDISRMTSLLRRRKCQG